MLKEKLQKHYTILNTRLHNKTTLALLKRADDDTLRQIAGACESILNNQFSDEEQEAFARIEKYRGRLLKDSTVVTYEVFNSDDKLTVGEICRKGASANVWGKFLYVMTKVLGANRFLEIGTNLGISGSYILEALKRTTNGRLVTMEGLEALCNIAGKQFLSIAGNRHFKIVRGLYQDTFPQVVAREKPFDMFFIDGNHRMEPTLEYFKMLKERCSGDSSLFIFDDINWSAGMKEAWEIIKRDGRVAASIDFYKLGVVIVKKSKFINPVHYKLFLSY